MNRLSITLSVLAIVLSAIAFVSVKCLNNTDGTGTFIAALGVLVTLLVAWQIYQAIGVEEKFKNFQNSVSNELEKHKNSVSSDVNKKLLENTAMFTRIIEEKERIFNANALVIYIELSLHAEKLKNTHLFLRAMIMAYLIKDKNNHLNNDNFNTLFDLLSKAQELKNDFKEFKDKEIEYLLLLLKTNKLDKSITFAGIYSWLEDELKARNESIS